MYGESIHNMFKFRSTTRSNYHVCRLKMLPCSCRSRNYQLCCIGDSFWVNCVRWYVLAWLLCSDNRQVATTPFSIWEMWLNTTSNIDVKRQSCEQVQNVMDTHDHTDPMTLSLPQREYTHVLPVPHTDQNWRVATRNIHLIKEEHCCSLAHGKQASLSCYL